MAATAPVRRKKRHFRNEAVRPPFDVELEYKENGEPIVEGDEVELIRFQDFQRLPGFEGFDFVRISQTDPERALRILVGEDQWDRFEADWRKSGEDFESMNTLMTEVMEHYSGATVGNS